ncbi:CPBP family intramembrane glutamic endopeptidase [Candidatus Ichthyocystis hellenicum]|uniref:CPBP family intramembrane glutamic endopeptidase n=1 Tax=Candidatus Ichthyocystis hellenicum TaxID=1561003 RepID=UPI000B85FEA8|nr:CPBP family intramembrane glutamic endopeptidase [Candidatus Ichthyocystis hellenicum]
MINEDISLRRINSVSSQQQDDDDEPEFAASSVYVLQEVVSLPPLYGENETPPPYVEEEGPFVVPPTTLLSSSLEVEGGVVSLGLESVSGAERNRYKLMLTYPRNRSRFSFSPRCLDNASFAKFFALMAIVLFSGFVFGVYGEGEGSSRKWHFSDTVSILLSFFILGVTFGYCFKMRRSMRHNDHFSSPSVHIGGV